MSGLLESESSACLGTSTGLSDLMSSREYSQFRGLSSRTLGCTLESQCLPREVVEECVCSRI